MTEYTETEHEGEPARLYPDGSLRDNKGYWLTKPPGAADDINSDNAVAMVERKVAKRRQEQAQLQEQVQRALVSQVAGAATPATAGGKLAGHLVAELDAEGAVKEHGIKNYVGGVDWVLKAAGLIKEKENESTVNIDKAVFLAPGTREHVAGLLQSLVAGDEDE